MQQKKAVQPCQDLAWIDVALIIVLHRLHKIEIVEIHKASLKRMHGVDERVMAQGMG